MTAINYAAFFETIKEETPLDEYKKYLACDVIFKDPFNNIIGVENIYSVFQRMHRQLDNPKFKIKEVMQQNKTAYLLWDFTFSFKGSKEKQYFEGVTRLEINEEKKIVSHIDYWDAAHNIYEKLPILSSMIKIVKKKIQD